MVSRTLALAAFTLSVASSVDAFWRLPCGAPVIVERADPIVNPGGVSGHVHAVSGASNFGPSSTFESLRASECTSCLVKQDMSAYWTPQMYFQWANGSFSDVKQVGGGLIYYLPRNHATDTTKVMAFPDGLRVLTGNPFLRSYSNSPMAQAIGWNCLGRAGTTRRPELPDADCPDGLRGEVRFPSCWNGVDLDSPNHFSHMAYPIGGETGPCPSTHSVRVVTLFYEIMWSVHDYANVRSQGLNATQPFVLAMGDSTGFGMHGDFQNGWDGAVLQEAIDTCTSDSGVIEYCKVFDLYETGHSCAKTPDFDEQVIGLTQATLPGCNPLTGYGPNATPCSSPNVPASISNPAVYTGAAAPPGAPVVAGTPQVLTAYNGWDYQDCYSDLVGGTRALSHALSTPSKTVEACLDACAAAGYTKCGVQYHGECWGSNELGASSSALGYGSCGLTCNDNALQYCGGSNPAAFEYYILTGAPSSTISPAASSTSTVAVSSTISSVAPSASASAPTKVLNSPDWTYDSCAADNVNSARSLPYSLSNPSATVESCLAQCKTAGYAVCGLSYGGECYGGAALSSASSTIADSKCSMKCNGAAAQTCGGPNALDVYLSKTVAILTEPTTPNLANFGPWSYTNCYSDLVDHVRSLPVQLIDSNSTIEGCLAACSKKTGTKLCGLSYYGECWSSTTTISSGSSVLPASSCNHPCKGNPLEWCGGSSALSVYTLASTTPARPLNVARTKPRALNAPRTLPANSKRLRYKRDL